MRDGEGRVVFLTLWNVFLTVVAGALFVSQVYFGNRLSTFEQMRFPSKEEIGETWGKIHSDFERIDRNEEGILGLFLDPKAKEKVKQILSQKKK